MVCKVCGSQNLYVKETRPAGIGYRRRRRCEDCGTSVTIYEVYAKTYKALEKSQERLKKVEAWLKDYISPDEEIQDDE